MIERNNDNLKDRLAAIARTQSLGMKGRVSGLTGLTVEAVDFPAPAGALCEIVTRSGVSISAELIGFRDSSTILMPFGEMTGIASGDVVRCVSVQPTIPIGLQLLGRVINGQGEPIDGKGPLLCQKRVPICSVRIEALERTRIDKQIGTGIRSVDAMLACGCGQRMGIFSGPGVGKSVLLGMISRFTTADVSVISLVGERGREVREFIEKDLGPRGLERSVVVVSTSDEPPTIRVQAAFVATTIAEYFRDLGKEVLLLMDSVTRVALAQRQIGLALGEPPATKGFTPSVFALLPRLVERCGRTKSGSITGFFSVLVEGDDLSEPISDAMRGLLDGHLWLSRDLANRNHYPAIDMMESISRVMPDIIDSEHKQAAGDITRLIAIYRDIEDLVNIGAYAPGTSMEFDLAVYAHEMIDNFLQQPMSEHVTPSQAAKALAELVGTIKSQQANGLPGVRGNDVQKEAPQQQTKAEKPSLELERMMAGL